MADSILIKGGTIVTMDKEDSIVTGDLFIRGKRIEQIDRYQGAPVDLEIDATGHVVLPGFVQTHIHLCQTLFRGYADDLSLIDWLRNRIWPMEAAHNAESVRASTRLGIAELIRGGTTCALTMETVNHTDAVFEVVDETGFRATVGKCMMDKGDGVPDALHEETEVSINQSLSLLEAWHGKADGRIRYCFAPRFAVSCTSELLSRVAALARDRGVMIHTHASENRQECELVEQATGLRNIKYLDSLGMTGPHVALAHCIHLNADEMSILKHTQTNVVHCPSSNLKLGSGIAPIKQMLDENISVSLGADGAACNNRLDMFTEMRTAALLQKALHGPEVLPASRALRMATLDGARAMGIDNEIGSLEIGKRADVILVGLNTWHSTPRPEDIISTIVYSSQASDVRTVIIDGRLVMKEGQMLSIDEAAVISEANHQAGLLGTRAGLGRAP